MPRLASIWTGIPPPTLTTSLVVGLITIATGLSVLFGWLFDIPLLKSVLPSFVTMKANTAVAFVLAGLSLTLWARFSRLVLARMAARACAGATALIGLLTLFQYFFGLDLRIDQLLFQEPAGAVGTLAPGRMAGASALNFLLLGCALLLAADRRVLLPMQVAALLTGLMGLLPLMGYLYGADMLLALGHYTQMALPTAALFILMSLGLLLLHPAEGLLERFTRDSTGGWLFRRVGPFVLGIPFALGWLRIQGEDLNIFDAPLGTALMMILMMSLFVGLIWWAAGRLNLMEARQQLALEALMKQSSYIREVMDNLPIGIATNAIDSSRVTYMNRKFPEIYGWPEHEFPDVGAFFEKVFPDLEYRQQMQSQIIADLSSGDIHRMDWDDLQISTKDGDRRVVHAINIPLPAQNIMVSTVQDITERKRAEAARGRVEEGLRQEQALNKTIIDSIPGTFYMLDETGHYVRWNAYQRDEIVGKPDDMVGSTNALDTIHPDDRELIQSKISNVLANGTVETVESRVLLRGGPAFRWLVMTGCRVLIDSRPFLVGIGIDITERKRSEDQLRASELRYRSYVDNAPYGIFVADGTGMYLEGNDVACEMIGCTHAELASLGIKDVVYQEDLGLAAASFGSVMQTGRASVECRYQKRSGEVGHWEVIGIKLSDDRVLGFVKDTTAQKKQEDEMRRFEASARQQQKLESIGTLASGVAHEINNPLNVVMNYGQLVLDDPTDPVRVKDYAKNIVNESDRIAVIVRNLLSFARQDKETHSPARIEDIVEQSLSLIRAVLRKDQIDLQCAIPPDLPMVKCRSQQIQQVLMNLLTNARDALNQRYPKAGEDKSIRIDASAFEKDGIRWIRLTVEDHGAGIQPDVADKVFDPFFTTKVRDKGTGLGLAISFGIVKEHHGELWFETEPGKGTRFHMDLRVNNGWSVQNPDEG